MQVPTQAAERRRCARNAPPNSLIYRGSVVRASTLEPLHEGAVLMPVVHPVRQCATDGGPLGMLSQSGPD